MWSNWFVNMLNLLQFAILYLKHLKILLFYRFHLFFYFFNIMFSSGFLIKIDWLDILTTKWPIIKKAILRIIAWDFSERVKLRKNKVVFDQCACAHCALINHILLPYDCLHIPIHRLGALTIIVDGFRALTVSENKLVSG